MRLAERSDFALRVLMFLAASGRQTTVVEMAERFSVSYHHLVKVVQNLSELGIVRTTRGRGGGVSLTVDPASVRVGDVIRFIEPDMALAECLRECGACPLHGPCRLTRLLEDASGAFLDVLNTKTIADLAEPGVTLLQSIGEHKGKRTDG